MEANFFRFLAGELTQKLPGLLIEKVHGPDERTLILTLYGQGEKQQLAFRPAKPAGLLFLSSQRPHNPPKASARVMWLRKRLTGRRFLEVRMDWTGLRLGCRLSPRPEAGPADWLVFDLRQDLTLDKDFAAADCPAWPPLALLLDDAEVWREFPQATPPLRKHLAAQAKADPARAEALLQRLGRGEAEEFFLPQGQAPQAWEPLPRPGADDGPAERFHTALDAARAHGERLVFTALARADEALAQEQARQAKRRLERQLALIERDEEKHKGLAALAIPAEALQCALSSLRETPKADAITLPHPEHGPVSVPLDRRLTPSANMARLFALAAKGRRGLEHCRRRRGELVSGPGLPIVATPDQARRAAPRGPLPLPKRYHGIAAAVFRTTDGFLVLRGKSSQANHELLTRAASPHDYWLHASGGPSAHVILRRDYPEQPVPEQSLLEAAGLCALKSWRQNDSKAEIMLARVKDVRAVKGAATGSVAVDQVERTLVVALDPELERRLAND